VRVVIAEDSVLLRAGLTRLLVEAGEDVVATVGDADELLLVAQRHQPDLAVVDVRMPPTHTDDGLRAALTMRERWPQIGILVLSQYVEERYATELIARDTAGVGYLLKDRIADVGEFLGAVRRVGAGGTALDPEVVAQLLARARRQDPLARLSPREREVLGLMAEGRTNPAIARQLVVSDKAVEKHVGNIFMKLNLAPTDEGHRRVHAVLRGLGGTT
jgi:DNA-binding NarL/FixJ family response regulator